MIVKLVVVEFPKLIEVVPVKLEPVIVTTVPPLTDPTLGLTPETTGALPLPKVKAAGKETAP